MRQSFSSSNYTRQTCRTLISVCAYSWECMQVQGMLPSPPHPPTQPKGMCVCVQLGMYASPSMLPSPPHPPTHPTKVWCVCAYSWECMQVQGMLPSPPHPPTQPKGVCVCVFVRTVGNVCKSKVCYHPHSTHPPTQRKGMCVCVCAYSWECMQVQGMLPSPPQLGMYASPRYVTMPSSPTHPPNPKVCVCVCVQLGMYASPRYVIIPTPPTHPPPTQPKGMCVQMSPQKHVVCTVESDLCTQMRLLECVYR